MGDKLTGNDSQGEPVGRERVGVHIKMEQGLSFRTCHRLFTGFQGRFQLHQSYNSDDFLTTNLTPSVIKDMTTSFEDEYKDKDLKKVTWRDFYDHFNYTYKELSRPRQLILGVAASATGILSILKPTDKKNICSELPNRERFFPDQPYDRKELSAAFAGARVPSEGKIKAFEKKNPDTNSLLMQDFYDFCDYTFPPIRLAQRAISRTVSDFGKKKVDNQDEAQSGVDQKNIFFSPKYLLTYVIAISVGLYTPLASKISVNIGSENERIIENYLSEIKLVIDASSEIDNTTMESLFGPLSPKEHVEKIQYFEDNMISFINQLSSIVDNSADYYKLEALLKQYTNLFDTKQDALARELRGTKISQRVDIISLIDSVGSDNEVLQNFKYAIVDLHKSLIHNNLRGPIDNKQEKNTPFFWRREDEVEVGKLQENSEPFIPKTPDIVIN